MIRLLNLDIPTLGILLALCGLVCLFLGLTRRAYAPLLSICSGLLLLLCGGLMWLLPRIHFPQQTLTRLSFLLVGIAFLAVELINYFRRLSCTVPWQGEFLDVATYGARTTGLSYGSAVFRYRVDGVSYQQSSLDKRFWLTFLTSPFQKKFTVGDCYTIYLNPNNSRRFALSRRPHFGLFFFIGGILLLAAVLRF